jgi:hypothetical protein
MTATPIRAVIAACLMLWACSPLAACSPKSGAPSAESHAPGTTTAAVAGSCAEYPKGAPGVANTFCDGPATVNLTVGAKTYTLHGGTCSTDGGHFSLNLGVVATGELAGPKPDYVGLNAPTAQGPFSNAVLIVIVEGKAYSPAPNTGEVGPSGGHFEGETVADGTKVSGSFTC